MATRLIKCGFDAAIELARHKHGGYGSIDLYGTGAGTGRNISQVRSKICIFIPSQVHSVQATGDAWKGSCGPFICGVGFQASIACSPLPLPQCSARRPVG